MAKQRVIIKWGRKVRVERRVCARVGCENRFWSAVYNLKNGQGRHCSRFCAISVMTTNNNKHRVGKKNPNWRGGVSGRAVIYKKRSVAKYPDREKARKEVEKALRKKKIVKQVCVFCGKKKTEAHHWDYKQPLRVTWLCRKHHVYADKVRRVQELFKSIRDSSVARVNVLDYRCSLMFH
jgi:hypothetical protein